MMLKTSFYFRGSDLIDTCSYDDELPEDILRQIFHIAYFCPECGEIFARLFTQCGGRTTVSWRVRYSQCFKCGKPTFLNSLEKERPYLIRKYFPKEMLKWQ